MEKITLKEISGYIPDVEILILNYKCDYVGIERAKVNGHYFIGEDIYLTYVGGSTGKKLGTDCKLILHSLEMLTETIVHNGVEIIPIVELAKINYPDHKDYTFELNENLCLVEIIGITNKTFGFNKLGDFWSLEGIRSVGISKQLKLFELLHELNFDLYGLLDRNLAIDKSTLNSK